MDIRISAELGWSEIFGGRFSSQSKCELELSQQYALIYADLAADNTGELDIFLLLNEAFGTSLPTGTILVQDAGFFTFSYFGEGAAPTTTLVDVFPQSAIPQSVAAVTTGMDSSCGFWLTLQIKNIDLFNSLIQIGYTTPRGAGDVLSLSAVLAKGTSAGSAVSQAAYTALLPNFTLFNIFTFEDIAISYQFTTSTLLSINGTLSVVLFDKNYSFSGALVSNGVDKTVTACLNSTLPGSSIPSLFDGAMSGISFSNLVFGVYAKLGASGQNIFQVQGSVTVGSVKLTGQIYLQGTTPEVASVMVDQTLSIGDVFNQCLDGLDWPTNLINITFKAGSELYYCNTTGAAPLSLDTFDCPSSGKTAPPAKSIRYKSGFNIQATFDLTLIDTIEVKGNIQIANGGVTASIALDDPIDLYILTVAAPNASTATGGPALTLSTVGLSPSMGFAGSLWFMQESFGVSVIMSANFKV